MEHYYQREIETAPREQIRALQSERLAATVRRVYERVHTTISAWTRRACERRT